MSSLPAPHFNPALDYYAILQVHPRAHVEVIKRAYRAIIGVLGAHPDHGGRHDDAVRLNEAYAVLTHPIARHAYDVARRRVILRALWARGTPTVGRRHGARVAHCRWCGAKNRLPAGVEPARVLCGKCHKFLASGW